jgi:hypothetical protein
VTAHHFFIVFLVASTIFASHEPNPRECNPEVSLGERRLYLKRADAERLILMHYSAVNEMSQSTPDT